MAYFLKQKNNTTKNDIKKNNSKIKNYYEEIFDDYRNIAITKVEIVPISNDNIINEDNNNEIKKEIPTENGNKDNHEPTNLSPLFKINVSKILDNNKYNQSIEQLKQLKKYKKYEDMIKKSFEIFPEEELENNENDKSKNEHKNNINNKLKNNNKTNSIN